MTLTPSRLKLIEKDLAAPLTPEQRSILLLWYGRESKFGWTMQDLAVGLYRVRHFYPDHRANLRHSHLPFPDDGSDVYIELDDDDGGTHLYCNQYSDCEKFYDNLPF